MLLWRSLEEWTAVRTGRDRGQPDDHMWALRNHTPFAADRNWTRDKDGHHWWIVAIRATNPGYLEVFSTPGGQLALAVCLVSVAVGYAGMLRATVLPGRERVLR